MGKQEQLIEFCIQDIVEFIVNDRNIPYDEAMNCFYSSETFSKLADTETGLYLESSAYVYDIYQSECENGKLIQIEIWIFEYLIAKPERLEKLSGLSY